ncbi:MAG: zinc ABC transporter substrate-binding protein [Candidatus Azobacteroides sp.]|nr:zinc ABC transporter substrate-binding protein [Candidatus Azobacteroides sp.]
MTIKKSYLFLFIALIGIYSCRSGRKSGADFVIVTILPQQYFAERIVGGKFNIVCMVPSGNNPESYEPVPSQLMKLSDCKAYFRIGYIGFELAWMDKLKEANPNMQLFNTSDGIQLLKSDHAHVLPEGAETDSDHSSIDPHTWSSPKNAAVIVKNMLDAFIKLDPSNESYYQKNGRELLAEIHQTDSLLRDVFSKTKTKAFVIYHPSLTYLAHDYGLTQIAVEHGGKEPSPTQLKNLIDEVRNMHIHVIFIQKEFDKRNVEIIAGETGCKPVQINPLGYDWKTEMLNIAQALYAE